MATTWTDWLGTLRLDLHVPETRPDSKVPDASRVLQTRPPPSSHPFIALARVWTDVTRANKKQEIARRVIVPRVVGITGGVHANLATVGDKRLESIHKLLDSFTGIQRTPEQRRVHWWCIQACLPLIYGNEWDTEQRRVMQEHTIKEIVPTLFCTAARRVGKTWSMAMFCIAILFCVPALKICIFATGKRASVDLLNIAKSFLQRLPRGGTHALRVVRERNDELCVAASLPPGGMTPSAKKLLVLDMSTSSIKALPADAKSELSLSLCVSVCVCVCLCVLCVNQGLYGSPDGGTSSSGSGIWMISQI